MMFSKLLTIAFMVASPFVGMACIQPEYYYEDYIWGVNNFIQVTNVTHTNNPTGGISTKYHVLNKQVVDLPMTVYVKLSSDTTITTDGHGQLGNITKMVLQYKLASDSTWTTVSQINNVLQGNIPVSTLPGAYFGRNNIDPQNIKSNDIILVRYYLTDGTWQNGDFDQMITPRHLSQDEYDYTIGESVNNPNDNPPPTIPGGWKPHSVISFRYSGYRRPIQ